MLINVLRIGMKKLAFELNITEYGLSMIAISYNSMYLRLLAHELATQVRIFGVLHAV